MAPNNQTQEASSFPDCWQCRHFGITYQPSFPYLCRAMGIKSRVLPAVEVFRADGRHCRGFSAKVSSQIQGFMLRSLGALITAGFAMLMLLPATSAHASIDAALAAMERGHHATAMRAFRTEAEKGNALAQANIGYLYEHGLGVPQSYVEAMAWYRKAAAQQQPHALFNIGTIYFYGYGVERNPREALTWFRKAAQIQLPEAQYMMGVAYHEGVGTPANAALALEWFVKAAQQGYLSAQMMAALVYLSGDAGKIEAKKSYIWADIAARNGSADASLIRDYASYKLSRSAIEDAKREALACEKSRYRQCPPL